MKRPSYPKRRTEPCALCGHVVQLERRGDGKPLPGLANQRRGRRNYWYTPVGPAHHCPDAVKLRELNQALTRILEPRERGAR